MTDEKAAAFNRMLRLQEHNRSNIPAIMAQKAMNSFMLDDETAATVGMNRTVSVIVYPQDPFIGDPEVRQMSSADIRPGLSNARVMIQDDSGNIAYPDDEGNYYFWPGTNEFDQVNSFYYVTFTLRMYERYARRSLPWSFPMSKIAVNPHMGDGANAFYNEQNRLIGFQSFRVDGEIFNSAQSADIVSHETAHAVLDGLRDLFNESFGLGPTAFHESFGDMTAVLVALHDDSLLERLLRWTDGNLRVDNFIATVAEHLTDGMRRASQEHVDAHTIYLRNAFNDLKNAPFDQLPYNPSNPETELGRESHNYSRLFTGVFYDIFVGIYEQLAAETEPRIAIHRARDTMGYLLVCAIELGPVGEFDLGDMAKAFLAANVVLYDGQHNEVMLKVFDDRGVLKKTSAEIFLESLKTLPNLRLNGAVNSALGAALFLEESVVPALNLPQDANLIPLSAYRNGLGHSYLTYFSHERVELQGEQYRRFDGVHIDIFGGLTLMFDEENRLRSYFYRPVTSEDIRQIKILVSEFVRFGLLADSIGQVELNRPVYGSLYMLPDGGQGLWWPGPQPAAPEQAAVEVTRLVKFPVIFDRIPKYTHDFLEYLKAWMDKMQLNKQ
jgi:hypothetical protein